MKNKLYCSNCGTVIKNTYFKCLDNYLQVNFFDTEEENCFCSEECFCKYLELEQLEIEENNEEKF